MSVPVGPLIHRSESQAPKHTVLYRVLGAARAGRRVGPLLRVRAFGRRGRYAAGRESHGMGVRCPREIREWRPDPERMRCLEKVTLID